jgi:hypothetical protein
MKQKTRSVQATLHLLFRAIGIHALTLGCAAPGSESTPESTFHQIQAAISQRDWSHLYDLVAPSNRITWEKQWDEEKTRLHNPSEPKGDQEIEPITGINVATLRKLSGREYFIAVAPRMNWGTVATDQLIATVPSGDRCLLKLKSKNSETQLQLIRESDKWYVLIP